MARADIDQIVARLKASFSLNADGTRNPGERTGRYGERYVLSPIRGKQLLADEGSYFVSTNPTIGTAAAGGIQDAFSDTVAAFVLQNKDVAGGKNVYPDYLKLFITVAPASAVSLKYALKLEPSSLRAPSAGNAPLTPVNCHGGDGTPSIAVLQAFTGGAFLTVPAASAAARVVGRGVLRGVIPVISDELIIVFGPVEARGFSGPTASATGQSCSAPPIVIPPQGSLTVHLHAPSNATTGLSAEYEFGHWER